MKQAVILSVTLGLISPLFVLVGCSCPAHRERPSQYAWQQTDSSLALVSDGNIIWQLNYDKNYDKPYFHPLALTDGTILTDCRPADHPWHRGLWWSWKFISRLNYWEDDPKTQLAPGRNEIIDVDVTPYRDGSAEARITVSYHPPGKPEILSEKRLLRISAPGADGIYCIDWKSEFTAADKDVLLDRTPIVGEPCGVIWGGYAGLSVRLAKEAKNWQAADSEEHKYDKEFNNAKARWIDYTFEAARPGKEAGIAVLDHPSNERHPTPWYVILGKDMRYFSPAFLYYEPYTLPSGKSLTLQYRIIVHPGRTDSQFIERQWQKFSKLKNR